MNITTEWIQTIAKQVLTLAKEATASAEMTPTAPGHPGGRNGVARGAAPSGCGSRGAAVEFERGHARG